MEYQKLTTEFGTIRIMDAEESELTALMDVYISAFTRHNIFQRPRKEILEYLNAAHRNNSIVGGGCIVAVLGNSVVGGMLIKKYSEDIYGKHVNFKYNHVAVLPSYARSGIGKALIAAADQKIKNLILKKKIKTAKIELGVSENEKKALDFFKKLGFQVEGKLKSHYRFGELVFVMGKEIIK